MKGWTRLAICGTSIMMLAMAVGCEEPIKEPPPPVYDGAADRIADLQRQLAQAAQNRSADQARMAAMQAELDRLRNQPPPVAPPPPPPPPAPQGWTTVPGGAMIALEGTVLFDSGKTVLKTSGQQALQAIVDTIQSKYSDHDIFIYGHTDNEPIRKSGWKDNYELSCQRALSVLRFFRSQGLREPIAACGWGEDRPIANNSSASARQANRRVEVYAMTPKQGSPPSSGSDEAQ